MRNKDLTYLTMAHVISKLSTCRRRSVGCILVDSKYRFMSSGYNGVPAGITHCTDEPCPFAEHQHGSGCFATHAETNAIAQCRNVDEIWTVFTTSYPCVECFKLIMNTGCKRVVYIQDYPATREQVERINSLAPCPIEFVQLSPYMDPSGRFISAEPS